MAGPFRGSVGKPKKERSKFKKTNFSKALVRRGRKLASDAVQARVEALIGDAPTKVVGEGSNASSNGTSSTFMSKLRAPKQVVVKKSKEKVLEVVGADGKNHRVVDGGDEAAERTTQELQGLKLLNRAVKDQSYQKILPHQQRHDYEFRLRRITTMGVVRLFNSLAQSHSAGDKAMDDSERKVTIDKAQERKLIASRDAFLAALRTPGSRNPVTAHDNSHGFY
jgi:hypothetical protein